jgi:hypothetical protein
VDKYGGSRLFSRQFRAIRQCSMVDLSTHLRKAREAAAAALGEDKQKRTDDGGIES